LFLDCYKLFKEILWKKDNGFKEAVGIWKKDFINGFLKGVLK